LSCWGSEGRSRKSEEFEKKKGTKSSKERRRKRGRSKKSDVRREKLKRDDLNVNRLCDR